MSTLAKLIRERLAAATPEVPVNQIEGYVWFVQGSHYCTKTKTEAEAIARAEFPEETEDQRYARIYFRTMVSVRV